MIQKTVVQQVLETGRHSRDCKRAAQRAPLERAPRYSSRLSCGIFLEWGLEFELELDVAAGEAARNSTRPIVT